MIRNRVSAPKVVKLTPKRKENRKNDSQNIGPFNTKGYFNPQEPFDERYLEVKQMVFEKYRGKKEEFIMLNINDTNKAGFIQRGLVTKDAGKDLGQAPLTERRNNLLKNYLIRKERREQIDMKFNEPKGQFSGIRQQTLISKISMRSTSSRLSNRDEI